MRFKRKSLLAGCCVAIAAHSGGEAFVCAQADRQRFSLEGTLLKEDGKPFLHVAPLVFLQGVVSPFTARELVDRAGKFRFKDLAATQYMLVAAVPKSGETRQTVDIGPSLADSKGRVRVAITWTPDNIEREPPRVSVTRLAVPDRAMQEHARAQRHLERRDVTRAEESLKRTLQLAPGFSEVWNELGVLCFQTQRYAEAESHFREALRQDPESYPPLVNLGGALVMLKRYEEALKVNLQAVDARPDDPLAHSQLGSSWFGIERLDKAEESFKRAIALEPGHFSFPQLRLARLYELNGDTPSLVRWLDEFLRLHPDAPQAPQARRALEQARRPGTHQ